MTRTAGTIGSVAAPAWGKLLLVAGLLGVALTAQLSYGQAPGGPLLVDDVIIVGLRTIQPQQIKAQLRTVPGQPFNPGIVQEDLRKLGEMRTFKVLQPKIVENQAAKTVTVTFVVEEFDNIVREIVFKYAHHVRAEELEKVIPPNIKRGNPLNTSSNAEACWRITDYYKKEGRYFASCRLEEGMNRTDTRVVFNITEGPIVRIRDISFTGNDTLASSPRLYTQIDTWKRFMGVQLLSSKFDPNRSNSDAAKLQEYYRSNGYLDARVTREFLFTDDHQYVDVVFHITEGLRYHVKDVDVAGTQVLPKDQVLSILKLHKGDLYDENVLDKDAKNITDLYGYRGFPAVVEKHPVSIPGAPGLVHVNYQIIEKKPYRLGTIDIVGNDVTKDHVVRHFLKDLYPGQIIQYPALLASERALARSSLFDDKEQRPTVTVIDRNDGFDSEYKDVLVRVKETMTGSLMFGASVNSDAGLVGSIVLNERNFDILNPPTSISDIWEGRAFRGGGQEFRLEAVPGTQVQRYSASWREPYLFDMPYSLQTSAYYFQRAYNEDLETRYGFNVAVGHQLSRLWNASVGLRVENVNISNVPIFAPPAYTSVVGDNFLAAPRITVARDDRDSFLRPTEGSLVTFTYEQLLGEFVSPVLSLSASQFFTTWQRADGSGKQVIMLKSQVSWAGENTPVYERFFAGGIQSLRGFEFRGVGPMVNGFNVGGDFMFLNSAEYQIPVLANDMLYFVGFVDSGTVESEVSLHDYRVSAGVGARILVPMLGQVPIAIDFGFPIVKAASDRTQVFSFYVGFFK